jgi:glycosyltransferase involved in cell wall biosynthesis
MATMKILMLTTCFTNVGTYFRAYFFGKELSKRGHQVTVVSISPNSVFRLKERFYDGVRFIECPNFLNSLGFHHGNGIIDIFRRIQHIFKEDYQIVHGFEYHANVTIPIFFTKGIKKYIYVSDWCDWFSKGMEFGRFSNFKAIIRGVSYLEEMVRLKAMGVTVISRKLENRVIEIGCKKENILYLPGGAPVDVVKPTPLDEAKKNKLMLANKKVGAFLGSYQLDFDVFIDAFRIVLREIPKAVMLIVGKLDAKTTNIINDMNLQESVIQTGWVAEEELSNYLACADVFLLPLRDNLYNQSRWPNKIGEYMAAGRPTIASNVGELVPLFKSNRIGLLVDNDVNDIAEKIIYFFQNPHIAEEMGYNARILAEREFSWKRLADRLESFYRQFLG